jgi:FkbM family methyltransferase
MRAALGALSDSDMANHVDLRQPMALQRALTQPVNASSAPFPGPLPVVDASVTVVVDAGARYGVHPTWRLFGGELLYLAVEPDPEEAQRLTRLARHSGFRTVCIAFDHKTGTRNLYVTKHRGYSSFYRPDLESEWFKRYRPGEGEVERVAQVRTWSMDDFARKYRLGIDFLKLDTEGSELDILRGAADQLETHVLGVRAEVSFQRSYIDQPLVFEVHKYLLSKGFQLLNFDYLGRGVPRNALFRNPNPQEMDTSRYGTLLSTDGVWLKRYELLHRRLQDQPGALTWATLKYAYFCILNHAPDVGIDTLLNFIRERGEPLGPEYSNVRLYRALQRTCAEFMGRWRVYPDAQWETVRGMFETIFGFPLEGGSRYWEMVQGL